MKIFGNYKKLKKENEELKTKIIKNQQDFYDEIKYKNFDISNLRKENNNLVQKIKELQSTIEKANSEGFKASEGAYILRVFGLKLGENLPPNALDINYIQTLTFNDEIITLYSAMVWESFK